MEEHLKCPILRTWPYDVIHGSVFHLWISLLFALQLPDYQLAQSWIFQLLYLFISASYFYIVLFPKPSVGIFDSESHSSPAGCSLRRRLILTSRPSAGSAGKFDKQNFSFFSLLIFGVFFVSCQIYLMHACATADLDLLGPTISACVVFLNPILTNSDPFLLPAGL